LIIYKAEYLQFKFSLNIQITAEVLNYVSLQ